jgi:heat shock protein HtpX
MPEAPEPVLVYTRIAANVRKTRWLVASFAVVLLPVVSAATSLTIPVISVLAVLATSRILGSEQTFQRILSIDAELTAARSGGVVSLQDLPSSVLWLTGGLLFAALAVVTIGSAAVVAFLVSRYGSRMLLRAAHAREIGAGEDPDLVRLVENLCIGAGLPMPRLYIVESPSPNAFATGPDPQHASLVITRGLLALVDRRELQGVIAHELSHIGNHDTRLTALLAALVGTTSLPWRVALAPLRHAFRVSPAAGGLLFTGFALFVAWMALSAFWFSLSYLLSEEASAELPRFMWWWAAHAMLAPVYALFVAPIVTLLIRQAVSREREFLADADAVRLTRDPEGLALALAKIGAAGGDRLRVGEGSVHLYIVDPRAHSLLHSVFPSHPPLEDRIELLAKMGSGIPKAALDAAIEAGRQMRHTASMNVESASGADSSEQGTVSSGERPMLGAIRPEAPADERAPRPRTIPLYERPDGWSKVLAELDESAALTPLGEDGSFVHVVTADNIRGYVSSSAPLSTLRSIVDGPAAQSRG